MRMNNFMMLLQGEIQRMKKYNILGASFLVSLIWIGVLHFTKIEDVTHIFPLLIFIDATSMSMLLVGVTMFFERQEGTIKTLLVSPISKTEYILSKTVANILSNVITLIILYLYARFFKEINVNIIALLGAVILISLFHSFIGLILTYRSRDFTELLIGMIKYSIVFMVPVFLELAGLIKNAVFKKALYVIPTKSSMSLLMGSVGFMESWEIWISIAYLVILSGILYFVVWKEFDKFSIKESGV